MALVRGVEPPPPGTIYQASRSVGRGSSDCFHGSRFFDLGLHIANRAMVTYFSTTNGINYLCQTLDNVDVVTAYGRLIKLLE